jgi:Cys-rich protein (TIGR01571 family)
MNWEIGLCEIGDPSLCLLSFIAPPCGAAVARHYLDQSPILFNICCLNPIAARWLIRTAYNINGDDVDDMCVGVFCPCCSINQVLIVLIDISSSIILN